MTWQANILDKIMQIMEAFKKAAIGYQFHVRSYLSEIILDLYRNNQVLIKKQVHNNIKLDRIYKMLAFIEDHYMEQIQIHQIAESAFISPRECISEESAFLIIMKRDSDFFLIHERRERQTCQIPLSRRLGIPEKEPIAVIAV